MEPTILEVADFEVIHLDQVDRYGGSGGIRDRGALESAVAQPQAGFGGAYLHADLFAMAAAYGSISRRTTLSSTGTSAPPTRRR